jgi:hypothetical protein
VPLLVPNLHHRKLKRWLTLKFVTILVHFTTTNETSQTTKKCLTLIQGLTYPRHSCITTEVIVDYQKSYKTNVDPAARKLVLCN